MKLKKKGGGAFFIIRVNGKHVDSARNHKVATRKANSLRATVFGKIEIERVS